MATLNAQGHKIIETDRRYEDYTSMKQWFSGSPIKEILFAGSQVMTAATVVMEGSDQLIGIQLAAEGVAFLSTLADDSNQDLKSVWCVYQDDTGLIHGPIEHLLNDTANTSIVAPIGNEDVFDTVASGQGTATITMTALNPGVDGYNGLYMVVRSGNQKGEAHLITATTADNPTVLTVTPAGGAALDADVVQIQTYPCDDFYRMREMYCEVEAIDSFPILLSTFDTGIIMGAIGEGHRYMANSGFFTQPTATCRSFLGKIKASTCVDSTVTEVTGSRVIVRYTPITAHANGGAVETTIDLDFADTLDWQPCIELEPATDVYINVLNIAGAALPNMFLEATYLEVYPTGSNPT